MSKPIDMSVLPDGMLIECRVFRHGINNNYSVWQLEFKNSNDPVISNRSRAYRPALNHWHHNDGTMTLPDGLVVDFMTNDISDGVLRGYTNYGEIIFLFPRQRYEEGTMFHLKPYPENFDLDMAYHDVIAVKILGVTAEYGAQLGMEVVEL